MRVLSPQAFRSWLIILLFQLFQTRLNFFLPLNCGLWSPPSLPPSIFCDFEICIGVFDARGRTGEDVWHANDEKRDEEGGAEKGGGQAGSRMEMGRHGGGIFGALRRVLGLKLLPLLEKSHER